MIDDALVVMPAFNEAGVIEDTLSELFKHVKNVLVVDDGSDDGTAAAAKKSGARVLGLCTNLNYGGALQAGFRYALRRTDFPYILTFDADGQHDPASIEAVLAPLREGRANYVLGSRYLDKSGDGHSALRRAGGGLISMFLRAALGKKFTDPTSGLAAMTREVANVFLLDLFPQDFPDADVIIMLDRMGFGIVEVPVIMRPSRSGKSMHGGVVRPAFYMAKMSVSMLHLATRSDLLEKRREAQIAG